eukprot:scaffold9548_cov108-Cylindrotheca_fusiformis.AAC.4
MNLILAILVSLLVTVPTVTNAQLFEGFDHCYVCGDADIAMTKPDNILLQDVITGNDISCSELQAEFDPDSLIPCYSTYNYYAEGYNLQSLCGCEGAGEPADIEECDICGEGQTFLTDGNVANKTYSCSQASESISHIEAASFCTDEGSAIYGVRESCCQGEITARSDSPANLGINHILSTGSCVGAKAVVPSWQLDRLNTRIRTFDA